MTLEFWRRWHMTLSQFLRDYLYIPLGGNRHGKFRRYVNLLVTMLLGGLWHGSGWNFVAWGGLHGLYLTVNHGWHSLRARIGLPVRSTPSVIERAIGISLVFLAVAVAWIFFRAQNLDEAILIIKGLTNVSGLRMDFNLTATLKFGVGFILVFLFPNSQEILLQGRYPSWKIAPPQERELSLSVRRGIIFGVLAFFSILLMAKHSVFLYFQF